MAEKFANTFQTTLSAGVTSAATSIAVADAAPTALRGGEARLRVGNELMVATIPANGASPWTVTRGAEGTTAASHAASAQVTHVLTAAVLSGIESRLGDTIPRTEKGAANGVASLGSNVRVPPAQLGSGATSTNFLRGDGTFADAPTVPDADAAIKGKVQLAGDLAGTAAAPTVPGAAKKSANLSDLADASTARTNIGLGNVNNTSDADKPVSTAQQTAINGRIPTTEKGVANGVASLGSNARVPPVQLGSGATATNFLRGDGTFAVPDAAGGPVVEVLRAAPLNLKDPQFADLVVGSDWKPALQALVNNGDRVEGYLPPGEYDIASTILRTVPRGLKLRGAGTGSTILRATTDAHLFNMTMGSLARVELSDMTLVPLVGSPMTVGEAIRVDGDWNEPGPIFRNVQFGLVGSGSEWRRCVNLIDCLWATLDGLRGVGYQEPGVSGCDFIRVTAASATTATGGYKLNNCKATRLRDYLVIDNALSPGIEGVELVSCDAVRTRNFVVWRDTSPYVPPMLRIFGGHSHVTERNFDIADICQVLVSGHLAYNEGSLELIRAENVTDFTVTNGTQLISIAGGDPRGIWLPGVSSGVKIDPTTIIILAPGTTKWPVQSPPYSEPNPPSLTNSRISGRAPACPRFADIGRMDPSIRVYDTDPIDTKEGTEQITIGTTLDVRFIRGNQAEFYGGAVSVSSILGGRVGQVTHFVNGNTGGGASTVVHSASILLHGGANYTFADSGSMLSLRRESATVWREVGRSG